MKNSKKKVEVKQSSSNDAKLLVSGSAVKNCHHPKGGLLKICIAVGCELCPHYR